MPLFSYQDRRASRTPWCALSLTTLRRETTKNVISTHPIAANGLLGVGRIELGNTSPRCACGDGELRSIGAAKGGFVRSRAEGCTSSG